MLKSICPVCFQKNAKKRFFAMLCIKYLIWKGSHTYFFCQKSRFFMFFTKFSSSVFALRGFLFFKMKNPNLHSKMYMKSKNKTQKVQINTFLLVFLLFLMWYFTKKKTFFCIFTPTIHWSYFVVSERIPLLHLQFGIIIITKRVVLPKTLGELNIPKSSQSHLNANLRIPSAF